MSSKQQSMTLSQALDLMSAARKDMPSVPFDAERYAADLAKTVALPVSGERLAGSWPHNRA